MTDGIQGPAGPKGDTGEKGDTGNDDLLFKAVDKSVASLIRQAARNKIWGRINSVVAAVLVFVVAGLGYALIQQHQYDVAQKSDSITSCEGNNAFRLAQVETWEKNFALQAQESKATASLLTQLIAVLAQHDPTEISQIDSILKQSAGAQANEISSFLKYVATVDAGRDCRALFSDSPSGS